MAVKRMFYKELMDSDRFLDLSIEAQVLYFHLSLKADDEGFLASVNKMTRMLEIDKKHIDELQDAEFIHMFESGVCVIMHWHIHNTLRKDRITETIYQKERRRVYLDKRKVYMLYEGEQMSIENCKNIEMADKCPSSDGQVSPQERVGKDSIDKDSIDKERVGDADAHSSSLSVDDTRYKRLLNDKALKIPYKQSSKALEKYIIMMDYECIQYAIEEAKVNDKHSLGYIRAILNRMIAEGITTKDKLDNNLRIRHGPQSPSVNDGMLGHGLTDDDFDKMLKRGVEL